MEPTHLRDLGDSLILGSASTETLAYGLEESRSMTGSLSDFEIKESDAPIPGGKKKKQPLRPLATATTSAFSFVPPSRAPSHALSRAPPRTKSAVAKRHKSRGPHGPRRHWTEPRQRKYNQARREKKEAERVQMALVVAEQAQAPASPAPSREPIEDYEEGVATTPPNGGDQAFWEEVRTTTAQDKSYDYTFPIGDLVAKLWLDPTLDETQRTRMQKIATGNMGRNKAFEQLVDLVGVARLRGILNGFKEAALERGYDLRMGDPKSLHATFKHGAVIRKAGSRSTSVKRQKNMTIRIPRPEDEEGEEGAGPDTEAAVLLQEMHAGTLEEAPKEASEEAPDGEAADDVGAMLGCEEQLEEGGDTVVLDGKAVSKKGPAVHTDVWWRREQDKATASGANVRYRWPFRAIIQRLLTVPTFSGEMMTALMSKQANYDNAHKKTEFEALESLVGKQHLLDVVTHFVKDAERWGFTVKTLGADTNSAAAILQNGATMFIDGEARQRYLASWEGRMVEGTRLSLLPGTTGTGKFVTLKVADRVRCRKFCQLQVTDDYPGHFYCQIPDDIKVGMVLHVPVPLQRWVDGVERSLWRPKFTAPLLVHKYAPAHSTWEGVLEAERAIASAEADKRASFAKQQQLAQLGRDHMQVKKLLDRVLFEGSPDRSAEACPKDFTELYWETHAAFKRTFYNEVSYVEKLYIEESPLIADSLYLKDSKELKDSKKRVIDFKAQLDEGRAGLGLDSRTFKQVVLFALDFVRILAEHSRITKSTHSQWATTHKILRNWLEYQAKQQDAAPAAAAPAAAATPTQDVALMDLTKDDGTITEERVSKKDMEDSATRKRSRSAVDGDDGEVEELSPHQRAHEKRMAADRAGQHEVVRQLKQQQLQQAFVQQQQQQAFLQQQQLLQQQQAAQQQQFLLEIEKKKQEQAALARPDDRVGEAWTKEEEDRLRAACTPRKGKSWAEVAEQVPGRTPSGCRVHWQILEVEDRRKAQGEEAARKAREAPIQVKLTFGRHFRPFDSVYVTVHYPSGTEYKTSVRLPAKWTPEKTVVVTFPYVPGQTHEGARYVIDPMPKEFPESEVLKHSEDAFDQAVKGVIDKARAEKPFKMQATKLSQPLREHSEDKVVTDARANGVVLFRSANATGYKDVHMESTQAGFRFYGRHDLEKTDPATTAFSAAMTYASSEMYKDDLRFMRLSKYPLLTEAEIVKASHEAAPVDPAVIAERDAATAQLRACEVRCDTVCKKTGISAQGIARLKRVLEEYEKASEELSAKATKDAAHDLHMARRAHEAANAKLGRLAAEAVDAALAKANAAREAQ